MVVEGDGGLADGVRWLSVGALSHEFSDEDDVRKEQVVGLVVAHGPVLRGFIQKFRCLVPVRSGLGEDDSGAAHFQAQPDQSPADWAARRS